MKIISTVIFLLLCSTSAFAQNGRLEERSFIHNDSLRSYLLYVPSSYTGSSEWPLVLNFHGFTDTAEGQVEVSQMNRAADRAKYLIAYPQGLLVLNPAFPFVSTGWNLLGLLSENDDLDFSKKVVEHIRSDYAIDQSRVHATGNSMGAGWSYELACNASDVFSAIAAVANQMAQIQIDLCSPDKPIPFLQIHGTADPIVPYDGFAAGDFPIPPAPATAAFWAEQNDCSPEPQMKELTDSDPEDESTVTLFEYEDCDTNAPVRFYRVNDGGHTWPGGGNQFPFNGVINRDINASAQILAFFHRNSRHRSVAFGDSPNTIEKNDSPELKSQNINAFPNPFARQITIDFETIESDHVSLALFDVTGRQVATVVDRGFAAGTHRIHWNASNEELSPGMYFLRLKVGGTQLTKPLLHMTN